MTLPDADARHALVRISIELLFRIDRLQTHLDGLISHGLVESPAPVHGIKNEFARLSGSICKLLASSSRLECSEDFAALKRIVAGFIVAHERLAIFPVPPPTPEIFAIVQEGRGNGDPDHASSVALGTLFNAFEFDFDERDVRDVVRVPRSPAFQLAICDHDSPTAWCVLGHELGHMYDRAAEPSQQVANEFIQEGRTGGIPEEVLRAVSRELWADLVSARLFGPAPIFSLLNMEYCVLPKRNPRWDLKMPRKPSLHPPMLWRLRVVADLLRMTDPGSDFLAAETQTFERAVRAVWRCCGLEYDEQQDEERFETCIRPLARRLTALLPSFISRPPIDSGALERCLRRLRSQLPIAAQGLSREQLTEAVHRYRLSAGEASPRRVKSFQGLTGTFREIPVPLSISLTAAHLMRQSLVSNAVMAGALKKREMDDLINALGENERLVAGSVAGSRTHVTLATLLNLGNALPNLKPARRRTEQVSGKPLLARYQPFSLLSDIEILERIVSLDEESLLFISPLVDPCRQLGPASLDLRLGTELRITRTVQSTHIDLLETADSTKRQVREYFDAQRVDANGAFVLHPGQFALASTLEYIRLPRDIAARLEGRSTPGRLGIQVHATAGFVDPGYEGSLTFELSNAGNLPVRVSPGYRLGQICFFRVRDVQVSYAEGERKYGRTTRPQLPRPELEAEIRARK